MPLRGWRIGRGSLETAPTDRLTADRLEGFLSFLGSDSPESPTDSEGRDSSEQASEAERSASTDSPGRNTERSEPEATSPLADSPPTAPLPAVAAPTVVAPAVIAPSVVTPVVAAPVVVAPTVVAPTVAQHLVTPAVAREVDAESDLEPSVIAPAAPMAAESRRGRHRSPTSSRLSIRGISFSVKRLALLAAVTVLVVVSAVLALT
jgi:hypothetical protein